MSVREYEFAPIELFGSTERKRNCNDPPKAPDMIDFSDFHRDPTDLRELIESEEFQNYNGKLPVALGKNMYNKTVMCDIAKMPHLLIGGSIKSGFNYPFLLSLIYKVSPDDLQLILIDPKRVELYSLKNFPHLMTPIVYDPSEAVGILGWLISEAKRRHHLFAEIGAADIDEYNSISDRKTMPRIVIYTEEFYYLMMIAPIETQKRIAELAEIGGAVGIHLILTTNRPKYITPAISEKFSARIALSVNSSYHSRVIIGQSGAEDLHIYYDLYFKPNEHSAPLRLQAGFISTKNVDLIARYMSERYTPKFACQDEISEYLAADQIDIKKEEACSKMKFEEMYEIVLDTIVKTQRASVLFIQRETNLPFTEVSRIFDVLESRNIVTRRYDEDHLFVAKCDINKAAEELEKQISLNRK